MKQTFKVLMKGAAESIMTDYQLKQIITMIYKILEANVEAGKGPQELLNVVAQLLKEPKIDDSRE